VGGIFRNSSADFVLIMLCWKHWPRQCISCWALRCNESNWNSLFKKLEASLVGTRFIFGSECFQI